MFTAVLRTTESPDALLARVRRATRAPALVLKPEFASAPALLSYSASLAFKRFSQGVARAKTVELEWLLALAGTRHIAKAVAFCQPSSGMVCVATPERLSPAAVKALGTRATPKKARDLAALARAYALPPQALKTYGVEDLLVEKIAVAAVD